ncbi:MAG: retropepsin-like aspartic protease, partial [Candidatus Thiodiazotropha sp.]
RILLNNRKPAQDQTMAILSSKIILIKGKIGHMIETLIREIFSPAQNYQNNSSAQSPRNQFRTQETVESGVRTSTELEGPEIVAMRRNWCIEEGYFVCVTIKNLPVTFLIDTGSNVTILSKALLARLPSDISFSVQPTNTKMLTVTGEVTPFLGKSEIEFEIGTQNLKHKALIADIENDGILGMDFLMIHQCDLIISEKYLKINGEKIRCFANSRNAQPRCCRVAVLDHVEIPPETEMVVEGFTKDTIDRRSTGLLEVDTKFLHSKGLLVAKALVCPTTGIVPVRIANPYSESCTIFKNTIVASYEPLEPAELLSVNASNTAQTKTPTCSKTDIPEHLMELYCKSSQCLTAEQQDRLKQLFIDHQNTFSKSSHDLGRTSIVEHKINIIPGTKPIKQQPYRLPLAKRQEAENEIKAMAEKDLIEPMHTCLM